MICGENEKRLKPPPLRTARRRPRWARKPAYNKQGDDGHAGNYGKEEE